MLQNVSIIIILLAILLASLHFLLGKYRFTWLGKIIGFILGFSIAHAPGALFGLILGHFFDMLTNPPPKKVVYTKKSTNLNPANEPTATAYLIYFDTLFSILGHFFKAGNQKSTQPSHTSYLHKLHSLMQQMSLDEGAQRAAWDFFKYGQHTQFNLEQALFSFSRHCGNQAILCQQLLRQIIDMATMQQPLTLEQYAILCKLAHALNTSTAEFAHLAPKTQQSQATTNDNASLAAEYKILGIANTASMAQIKWAYRKLMGRYHPDRLMSKDLPEEFIELATQRTQEIKAAYEKICKARE